MFDTADSSRHYLVIETPSADYKQEERYNDDNDIIHNSKNYYIPSLDDISSISTSASSHGTTFFSNNHSSLNRYGTPRSLSRLRSIESEIDNLPLVFKTNIWSNEYSVNHNKTANLFANFTLESGNFACNLTTTACDKSQLSCNDSSYATTSSQVSPVNNIPVIAADTNSRSFGSTTPSINTNAVVSGTPYSPPPSCLTFRTYTGAIFTVPKTSKFFVIKSYNILDVNASFIHNIWTSTELGNRRLDKAYTELAKTNNSDVDGKIFLFFSVNSSGKFCGIAEMKSAIDFTTASNIWCEQTRWKGIFPVEWLLIKDVPNKFFQHLKIPANDYKPVTNSRDTQEIPFDIGISMLKIVSSFKSNEC
ncbi:uncharacterized YTH domain-containing protein, putative [Candida dubliniensis CD36]|uniref:Uncharacterized YTH domain-containing protein, putative n=1 Tax=Candida dubliniensis (strain CD36 / ATCC MYA-646 / CBS 7987 / NCPF 3949 / NRRL Y-17841) TaxID=573826 RepID=B9WH44_CANDC|nr:uncharacterized YTH domain-containing protein, putative [Candida dubliniensis CD36]CAX41485.1 uncharacterized YTH domain-containing protein, putative [Candida dubliniensis CD36]